MPEPLGQGPCELGGAVVGLVFEEHYTNLMAFPRDPAKPTLETLGLAERSLIGPRTPAWSP